MCWQCDHPEATWHDYLAHLRELLQRHCWIVQGVQRERHRPPYAYTIGLAAHGRPELVVTGLPYDRAVDLLNGVAEHVLHADAPRAGEVIALRGGPVVEIVRIAEPSVHLPVAAAISGPGFTALQLVYADDRGHWPWDAGFRGGRGGQPVLGARAVPGPGTGEAAAVHRLDQREQHRRHRLRLAVVPGKQVARDRRGGDHVK